MVALGSDGTVRGTLCLVDATPCFSHQPWVCRIKWPISKTTFPPGRGSLAGFLLRDVVAAVALPLRGALGGGGVGWGVGGGNNTVAQERRPPDWGPRGKGD